MRYLCYGKYRIVVAIVSLIFIVTVSGCDQTSINNTTIGQGGNNSSIKTGGQMEPTTISGNVMEKDVLIVAAPLDGGTPVKNVSDDKGNFSLDVQPGIHYGMSGIAYDQFGQYSLFDIRYPDGNLTDNVTLVPGEKVILNAHIYHVHAPKSWQDASHDPVTIRGRVFLDGKPVSGAVVKAISAWGDDRLSTFTIDNGVYAMDIKRNTQYRLTATYQGLQHTVWPVYQESGEAGHYDVNLTSTPTTLITGVGNGQPWLRRPGAVNITVTPVYENNTVTPAIGNDSSFSLEVEPYVYYDINGMFRSLNGSNYGLGFVYNTGINFRGFMLRPNETALVYYFAYVPAEEYNRTQ